MYPYTIGQWSQGNMENTNSQSGWEPMSHRLPANLPPHPYGHTPPLTAKDEASQTAQSKQLVPMYKPFVLPPSPVDQPSYVSPSDTRYHYGPRSLLTGTVMLGVPTPSTENSGMQQTSGVVIPAAHQRPDHSAEDCINDIRKICNDTQARVQALCQAIGRQPGMPAALSDLLNNDLRNVAQQFVTTHYYCHVLEKKIEERNCQGYQDRVGGRGSQEAELNNLRKKLQQSQDRVSKLERDLHDIQEGYANTDKRRKAEIEKKTEKITNQKRRIKEQQDQIDNLKRKSNGSKAPQMLKGSKAYDSSPEIDFYHSATSDIGARRSPQIPEPKYTSTLDGKDEEFLLNNLKKLNVDFDQSGHNVAPLASGPTRMERDNHVNHAAPPPNPYGNFGMPLLGHPGQMGPMNAMNGALAPYGAFPPMGPYGGPVPPNFGRPPPNAQMPHYAGFGGSNYPNPNQYRQARHNSQAHRGPESHSSNALVVRRNDDAEFDPEVRMWKDLFFRLFTASYGWAEKHCKQILPGAVEDATKANPKLWDYILKVAACHKDVQAAPKHALFLLNSPDHRCQFISRLLLQYIEQEMLRWKFWLGWDDETDVQLNKIGPVIDYIGFPLEQRRAARQELRQVIEGIVKDEEWPRFRSFKTAQHANRLKDIAGPFLKTDVASDASLGLHSLCNVAIEISNKMMSSRLSFAFTWNECAVKFSHDSHIALNSDLHGLSLQQKHVRVCLIVTPSVSYRDDSGISIVPRGVCKAQVLVMN